MSEANPSIGVAADRSAESAERRRKQQRRGRNAVIAALTVLMLSVPWVTYEAYRNLRGSVEVLERLGERSADRLLVEEMRRFQAQAAYAVLSYNTTLSEADLQEYQVARMNLDALLSSLSGPAPNPALDTLKVLTEARFVVLDKWVNLAENAPAAGLNTVQQAIDEAQRLQADSIALRQISSNRRRDLKEEAELARSGLQEQAHFLNLIESRLDAVRRQERQREDARRKLNLQLAAEDELLSQRIALWLDRMDRLAMMREDALNSESRTKSERVNQMIFLYGVMATAILLLLSSGLVVLFRRGDLMQAALERTLERERGLVRAREAFLANMSHELRTPLHAIAGFSSRLMTLELSPRAREFGSAIADASGHLRGLVEHILDYARERSGNNQPLQDPLLVRVLLEEVISLLQPRAESKSLELSARVEDSVPPVLAGDPLRLRQALINLAGNAVKFTQEGYVQLLAKAEEMEQGRTMLILEVADSGPGIPESERERIFEPFRQGGEDRSSFREGLGLGLAITVDLVRGMGGTLELDSEPGKGSVFRIKLPLKSWDDEPVAVMAPSILASAEAHDLNAERSEPILADSNGGLVLRKHPSDRALPTRMEWPEHWKSLRILAADDEAFNRKLLASLLEGLDAEIVEDGEQALEAFKKRPADLLLLDVRMPGMDGHQTLKAIRAEKPGVVAAAITAGVTEAEKLSCSGSGFDEILAKPFSEAELFALMESLLPLSEPGLLDLDSLMSLAGEDPNFVADMLKLFQDRLEITRVEWEEAIARGDTKAIAEAAHKLAAPARQLGFVELANTLRALEHEADGGASISALANRCRRLQPMLHTTALRVAAELEKKIEP